MVVDLRQVRTAAYCRERLKMLVKTSASWLAHVFSVRPDTLSGPAALVMSFSSEWISPSGTVGRVPASPWAGSFELSAVLCVEACKEPIQVVRERTVMADLRDA
ncbi:hypothetical protein LDENG_00151440, partial [Lucifuga dentata]